LNNIYIEKEGAMWIKHGQYAYEAFPNNSAILCDRNVYIDGCKFVRSSYEFDCENETDWWFVIKDNEEDLSSYSSNHRNQIRKGLKNIRCVKIDKSILLSFGYPIYEACMNRYNMTVMNNIEFRESVEGENVMSLFREYYGLFYEDELIGYAKNLINEEKTMVFYEDIYILPEHRKLYPNYCLLHTMNKEYLNERKYDFVSDGTRTLLHPSGIQDFLIRKFGFRKAYAKLHISYPAAVKAGVILTVFLNQLSRGKIARSSSKLSALLLQHQIHKSFL